MIVDAHHHLWDLNSGNYDWITPEHGILNRTYLPEDFEPELRKAGVDKAVTVQAADAAFDTEAMLDAADRFDWVAGVVGWVPMTSPDEAAAALDRYCRHPRFRGVRHQIHGEPDPDWLLQDTVMHTLGLLAERDLVFDVVAVLPRHLEHVPVIAERQPSLRMVIDHLAKPPILEGRMEPWRSRMADCAACPNVFGKVSGLNTAADMERWTAADLQPYVDAAVELFGPARLLYGSDWPVSLLAGDYQKVWHETNKCLAGLSADERADVLGGTATRVYRLT
jgi:L-fuconolactonase